MTMYVVIEHQPDGMYAASVIGMPTITAQGATETEALNQVRETFTARLRETRIVPIDIELSSDENPWLQFGTQLKDNPLLDEVTQAIEEHRKQLDANEAVG